MTGSTDTAETDPEGRPEIQVLGRPHVIVGSAERAVAPGLRPLLVELVFAGEVGVEISALHEIWPERSRAALQTAIWRLRRLLGSAAIVTRGEVYRIGRTVVCDLDRFERRAATGIEAFEAASLRDAVAHLRSALSTWRGPVDPVRATEAGRTRRERTVELRATVIEHLASACIDTGSAQEATVALRDLVDEQPFRERAWALLVSAHDACGESTLAAAVATEAVGVLSEAGVEPSDALAGAVNRTRRTVAATVVRRERSIPDWLAASRRGREFVGRVDETELLIQGLERAGAGHSTTAIVAGMSGSGKTRLFAETAALASARGMAVYGGRWDRHVRTPHQGLVEVLRGLVDDAPSGGAVADVLESYLTPAVGSELRPEQDPPDLPQILASVGNVFADVAAERPAMVVLDDVQWASRVSLLMLRHLVHANPAVPLALVVGLNTSVAIEASTRQVLGSLVRPNGSRWIELEGLTPIEVAALPEVARAARALGEDSRSLADAIVTYTGGNPLLIDRVLDEPGFIDHARRSDPNNVDPSVLPARVAAAAGTFLADLDEVARRVLGTAALIGREFDLALLQRVVEVSVDAALTRGVGARIVDVRGHRGSFSHDLLAEALVDAFDLEVRQATHARIAEVLRDPEADESEVDVFALAHHLDRAGPHVPPRRVTEAARRAAIEARSQFAFGVAAQYFEIAANHAPLEPAVGALLEAVEVSALDGDAAAAQRLLDRAERLARSGAPTVVLGKVAVATCDLSLRVDGHLSDEALALVHEVRAPLGADVDDDIAADLAFFASLGRDSPRGPVEVARAETDPDRGLAIAERGLELGPLAEQEALVRHLHRSPSTDGRALGALWEWVVGVQEGAVGLDDADRAAELDGLAAASRVTDTVRWRVAAWHATRHIARGEFRSGGEFAERAAGMGKALADRRWRLQAVLARWTHYGCLEFLTGSPTDRVNGVGHHWGTGTLFARPWDAHRLAWAGRFDEAKSLLRKALEQHRRRRVPDGPRLVRLVLLSSAAHAAQDETTAPALREEMAAHQGRTAVHASTFLGLIDHNASLVAAWLGDLDGAVNGFRAATDQAMRQGAIPYAVLSRMQLVRHLEQRGAAGDRTEAAQLRPVVVAEAERLGMPRVVELLSG